MGCVSSHHKPEHHRKPIFNHDNKSNPLTADSNNARHGNNQDPQNHQNNAAPADNSHQQKPLPNGDIFYYNE